jgi:hypothetical protein
VETPDLILAGIDQKASEIKLVPFKAAINLNQNSRYLRYALPPLLLLFILLFAAPSLLIDSTERLIYNGKEFIKPSPFQFSVTNEKLETESHPAILNTIGMIYANQKVPGKLSFFRESLNKINDYEILAFYEAFLLYGLYTGPENTTEVMNDLHKIIFEFDSLPWKRLGGMATLNNLRNLYREQANKSSNALEKGALEKKVTEISGWIEEVMNKEQLTELKNVYQQLQLVEKE